MANNLSEISISSIINNQHGFVKGGSILTNLIFYNNSMNDIINDCTPNITRQID